MNDAQSMSTEIEIMKRIRHRNIVSMYELYETPKCLWIILELVDGGDMHHFLAKATEYNEVIASRQMKQILSGVHYLHSLGENTFHIIMINITHLSIFISIQPSNILLKTNCELKVSYDISSEYKVK
jgi:serine/threonine protein kinase